MIDTPNTARASGTKKRTRIQQANEERILDAGLELFSSFGFRGATIDQIAEKAGMSKPNLLYYFRRKSDIYTAVLIRTLEMWLEPMEQINVAGDPKTELQAYVSRKIGFSKNYPEASRLFMNEILQGAPLMKETLEVRVKSIADKKAEVLRAWAAQHKLANIDPYHVIFMIWAMTQHYADFEVQIRAIIPDRADDREQFFQEAGEAVSEVLLHGLLPR